MVENPGPTYRQTEKTHRAVVKTGRSYAGSNLASRSDVKLFEAVLDGNHVVRGFRNADIREALHGTTADSAKRRRQSAAVGRLLKRLHVRGLIERCPVAAVGTSVPKDMECSKVYYNSITGHSSRSRYSRIVQS